MANKRIFYASHAVAVLNETDGPYNAINNTIPGAQSVSINTNFDLAEVFQLGRLALYDNFPANPEVEVTINKALDGRPLIWNFFTGVDSKNLQEASNDTASIILAVGNDDDADGIIGPIVSSITMTGCYVNSLNYTFPVDDNFTEELTFVGNHKRSGGSLAPPPEDPDQRIIRRQNFRLDGDDSTLPEDIVGKCISNVTISADLGREALYCLGSYAPFHRYVNFPLEITVTFDVTQDGNAGTNLAGPNFDVEDIGECQSANDISKKEPIVLAICRSTDEGGVEIAYEFDLGSGCAIQSVSYSGGDTGGGNVTETYTYQTYNELKITFNP
jgi:hypothetical protein